MMTGLGSKRIRCGVLTVGLMLTAAAVPLRAQAPPPGNAAPAPVPASAAAPDETDPNAVAEEALLTALSGQHVQVSLDGQTWQPAQQGDLLGRDARVRTGFASTCDISFGDTSVIHLKALSSLRVADYLVGDEQEQVRAHLEYGALRCGVAKGRVQADTRITTPVSTLAIRGTITAVEYDPGTRRCLLRVDEDGPALARNFPFGRRGGGPLGGNWENRGARSYRLHEGQRTNESLNRFLQLARFERVFSVTGDIRVGGMTPAETRVLAALLTNGSIDPFRAAGADGADLAPTRGRTPPPVVDDFFDGPCYDCWQSF